MSKKQTLVVAGILLIVLVGIFLLPKSTGSTALNGFAQCLKDQGATFYGAWWCPHCQAQKKLFGGSAELLPYVECSTPDGKSQTAECTEKGVSQYPTWVFANGEKLEGEVSLAVLAEKSTCTLPQ